MKILILFITLLIALLLPLSEIKAAPLVDHKNASDTDIPISSLDSARKLVVWFGHQSVGNNIIQGLQSLSRQNPERYRLSIYHGTGQEGGGVHHFPIGRNGDPYSKIDQFSDLIRRIGRSPGRPDIAMVKLCFVDLPPGFEPAKVFTRYREAMEELENISPETCFVWWTQPLRTNGNAVRNAFNRAIREYCLSHGKSLFDIADIESHDLSGRECSDENGPSMCPSFSTDGGHLNEMGSERVAHAWWAMLSQVKGGVTSTQAPASTMPKTEKAAGIDDNNPKPMSAITDLRGHMERGGALQNEGKLAEAEKEFRAGIALNPNSGWAHGMLGLLFQLEGRLDEAETELREAVRVDPNNSRAKEALQNLLKAREKTK